MLPPHISTFPVPTTGAVDCMTTAAIPDCRFAAAHAPLWALVEAHRLLRNRQQNKTRLALVAAAMKRRFGLMAGSDAALVKKEPGARSEE
jgi:hypothetical protein